MNKDIELTGTDFLRMAVLFPELDSKISSARELVLCAYEQGFCLSPVLQKQARNQLGEYDEEI